MVFWAYYHKSQEKSAAAAGNITNMTLVNESDESIYHQDLAWNDNVRHFCEVRFANLMDFCIPAFTVSYIFFFAIGGYLHVSNISFYILMPLVR